MALFEEGSLLAAEIRGSILSIGKKIYNKSISLCMKDTAVEKEA